MGSRDMMFMQLSSPIAWQLLMVLACWTSALFFGFGLVSRLCVTTVAALAVGATVMGGAIFLILDLSQPYSGVIRLSPAPLVQAIAFVDQSIEFKASPAIRRGSFPTSGGRNARTR